MSVALLERQLAVALTRPLPGLAAQLRLAPRPRVGWDPYRIPDGLRDGAALLLVYPRISRDSEPPSPHIVLTVRGSGLRKHTGQVSLPGGAVDPDESIEAAALREAHEETGISPGSVRVLGRLTPVHIPVSGYLLHPVLGVADVRPDFRIAESEVARLLEVPVALIRDPGIVKWQKQTRHLAGSVVPVDVPYFEIEGEIVWGATAMIVAEFLALSDLVPSPAPGGN
jgi:8-oxo-dGTP pyrophosphatase MutT (NUDIX family)